MQKWIILIAVCIIAEILISNYAALSILFGGYNEKELSLETAQIENNKSAELKDNVLYISEGKIIFDGINESVSNVCIHTKSSDGQYKRIELSLTDDNFAYSDGFEYNHVAFYIYENEVEQEAMCAGALRVLRGEEEAKVYTGKGMV